MSVSQCLPSRTTLLTGLAAHSHGVATHSHQEQEIRRPAAISDRLTVPSLLREAGYRTVLVGKWHLPSDPWRVGFSETRVWLPAGARAYEDPSLASGETRKEKVLRGYTQEIFADSAIGFLESNAAEHRPFFLWLAFTAPHAPYEPNPERIEALYRDVPAAELPPAGVSTGISAQRWRRYYAAISHLDEQVGRVRAALERGGLAGSTVLVFLGDNGFMMGEKGIGGFGASGKVVPYESSIRVPMVVRAPEIQAFSGPSQLLVSALDLPPTIAGLAGIEAPPSWPGRNLLPALRNREAPGFEDAFSEWADDRNESYGHLAHRLVRTRDHKLIVWQDPARPNELYELARDPREEENLSDRPEVAEVEADLMRRLRAWLERTADPARGWPKLAGIGHEAEDTRLERRVAVKLIHPEVASKPGSIERFRREARALASLDPAQVERILGEAMRK